MQRLFTDVLTRTSADQAATVILKGIRANKPKVLIGLDAQIFDVVILTLGSAYQRPFAAIAKRVSPKVEAPRGEKVAAQ